MIIGIAGRAGSGKDTAAKYLSHNYGYHRLALADPIYTALAAITGYTAEELHDRAIKERVIDWIGKSPRQMAQSLGTEWGRSLVHPELWVEVAMRRAKLHQNSTISDIRFDNEAKAVLEAGGEVWEIFGRGYNAIGEAAAHSSERGISPELVTRRVRNSGTLDEFYFGLETAYGHALRGRIDSRTTHFAG